MKIEVFKNKKDISMDEVMELLHETYWASNRTREVAEKSIEGSDTYFAIDTETNKLVGFARVISDYATNYYLSDVALGNSQGQERDDIADAILDAIISDPAQDNRRGILLSAQDHNIFAKHGFIENRERCMQRPRDMHTNTEFYRQFGSKKVWDPSMPVKEEDFIEYEVHKNDPRVNIDQVMALMKESYWGNQRSVEIVSTSVKNSDCFYAIAVKTGELLGMCRVITDHATNYYLCDVIVDEKLRYHGIGRHIIGAMVSDPELTGLRGILLTRDAHGFYEKFDFVREPDKCMEHPRADQKIAEAAELAHSTH